MNTNRRSFLDRTSKTGLTAILAASAAPAFVSARAQKPKGKLGVALVGLGGFSERSIAPEIASSQHVWFAGAVTGDPEGKGKAWAKQYGFPEANLYTYDQMDRLTDNPDIDFVHIVTPNGLHAEHTLAAAKAGKHVLCEKPMAISSVECEQMIAACHDAGVLLGINYRLHWEPHHVKAIELLAKGAAGDLSNGNYEFSWGYTNALSNPNSDIKKWLLDPKMAGGGALFDTGVYPIQAACYLTGKTPVSVRGFPSTRHPDLFPENIEETMSFEMIFDDGFQALGRASYSQNFHQCTTLGPKGRVEILPGEPRGSVFGQSGGGHANPKLLAVNGKDIACEDTLQLAVLHDQFAKSILEKSAFQCPGEMGLRDIQIVEAIYASASKNGVSVPLSLG